MSLFYTDAVQAAQLPTAARIQALKRILPRAKVDAVLRRTGFGLVQSRLLSSGVQMAAAVSPQWDAATLDFCEARQRLGVAPIFHLAQQAVELRATPDTPGAYYQNMRLMALDGLVLDVARKMSNWRKKRPVHRRTPQPTMSFRQSVQILS